MSTMKKNTNNNSHYQSYQKDNKKSREGNSARNRIDESKLMEEIDDLLSDENRKKSTESDKSSSISHKGQEKNERKIKKEMIDSIDMGKKLQGTNVVINVDTEENSNIDAEKQKQKKGKTNPEILVTDSLKQLMQGAKKRIEEVLQ